MRRNAREVTNKDIRERITKLGFFDWQIARKIGISASTFCIWMREELNADDERRQRVEEVLTKLEKA